MRDCSSDRSPLAPSNSKLPIPINFQLESWLGGLKFDWPDLEKLTRVQQRAKDTPNQSKSYSQTIIISEIRLNRLRNSVKNFPNFSAFPNFCNPEIPAN